MFNQNTLTMKKLVLLIAVTIVVSCEKDSAHYEIADIISTKNQQESLFFINDQNDFDYAGSMHNNFLHYYITNTTRLGDFDEILIMFDRFMLENYEINDFSAHMSFYPYDDIDTLGFTFHQDFSNMIAQTVHNNIIDSLTAYYFTQIYHNTWNIECAPCNPLDVFQEMIDDILILENEIINTNDSSLSVNSKRILLTCSSILRHSIGFWFVEFYDSQSPWNTPDKLSAYGNYQLPNYAPWYISDYMGGMAGLPNALQWWAYSGGNPWFFVGAFAGYAATASIIASLA